MAFFSSGRGKDMLPTEVDEAQPLLGSKSADGVTTPPKDGWHPNCSHPCELDSASSSEDESDTGSVDSGDDEAALKVRRRERLGGWLQYLKSYTVFWPYIWPSRNRRIQFYYLILGINTLAVRALNVLLPRQYGILVQAIYDSVGTGQVPWEPISVWMLLVVLSSDSCGIPAVSIMLEERIDRWSTGQLSLASFEHVMGLSMQFHDNKDSGEIIRAIEQATSLNGLLRTLVFDTAPVGLDLAIACWYVTYLLDAYAILIIFFVAIAYTSVTYLISAIMTKSRRTSASKERKESKRLYESVSNWTTVSYFNRSSHEKQRLGQAIKSSIKASQWNDDVYVYLFGAQELCETAGRIMISVLAAWRIAMGWTPAATFVTIEVYWSSIMMPLWMLGHSYRKLNSDLVDAERLLQLFETRSNVQDAADAKQLAITDDGRIVFENVCFSYDPSAIQNTLSDVSFEAAPGQTIALVGETGSGKSTTLKLLMRFYDATSGIIKVDGQDIRDVTLASLRESFGFVPQAAALFNMSIRENVRYGRIDASDEEVHRACKAACMHDKILTFPKGYDTKVGERGVKLSGGELQRIAIARVILKDPRIVLLDEATSSLDSETESQVQEALARLTAGRTTLVIAHRLSTVTRADCILVVNKGKIVERGTHLELVSRGGRYAELWKRQTLRAIEDVKEDVESN